MILVYRHPDSPEGDFGPVKQEGDERFVVLTPEEHRDLRERVEAAEGALAKIDAIERSSMWNRCFDCDYPKECSEVVGCVSVNNRGGSLIQQACRLRASGTREGAP